MTSKYNWEEGSWINDSPYIPPTATDYVWICWKTLEKYEEHLECCPKRSALTLIRSIQAYHNARAEKGEVKAEKQIWFWRSVDAPELPEYYARYH
jgi:hypothetical protein